MDALISPLLEVLKSSLAPVKRHFGYLIHYKKNVEELEAAVNDLEDTQHDIEQMAALADKRGELIKHAVKTWLRSVNIVEIRDEMTRLKHDADGINSCFQGWCSSRYHLGKEAKEKIDVITKNINDGKSLGVTVSDPAPPPTMGLLPTGEFKAFAATKVAMRKIMDAAQNDEVYMIGVHGMAGVGKTTLMKQVAKQIIEDKCFDTVVMAIVSQNPDLESIQNQIAEGLGVQLPKENVILRAAKLSERLEKENKILFVLDDLWARLELTEVGIPELNKNCKVVFTTRSQEVCDMMQSQAQVEVHTLSVSDSWNLFRYHAGEKADTDDILEFSKEIVKYCDGLPLAIVTLGRALRGKGRNVWDDAALQLKRSLIHGVAGMNTKVFTSIKLSYDYLESEEMQKCFILCCFFPEDFKIYMDDELFSYVIGEDVFGETDNLMEMRLRLHAVVDKLVASGLLLKVSMIIDGHRLYTDGIMMHDVVRDVAISIASEKYGFVVKAGIALNKWPGQLEKKLDKCWRLSLMENRLNEIPDQFKCSNLLTLSLHGNKGVTRISDNFFEGIPSLVILDLSGTSITSLSPSLSGLTSLRVLLLDDCDSLSDVSFVKQCRKLEVLSLGRQFHETHHSLLNLIEEMKALTNLKFLKLYRGDSDIVPPNIISSLSALEELDMRLEAFGDGNNSFSFAEVASLPCLTGISLRVTHAGFLSEDIPFNLGNSRKFSLLVNAFGILTVRSRSFEYWWKTLELNMADVAKPMAPWVTGFVGKTEHLELRNDKHVKSVGQLDAGAGLNIVKCLRLISCCQMEYILKVGVPGEYAPQVAFRMLTELCILFMRDLKAICQGPIPLQCFQNLQKLYIGNCNNMRYLLSVAMTQRLRKLEELRVLCCSEMLSIIEAEEVDPKAMASSSITITKLRQSIDNSVFPRLRVLQLSRLPKLFGFYQVLDFHFDWPSLEELHIESCPNLKKLPLGPNSAPNLKEFRSGDTDLMEKLEWENQTLMQRLGSRFVIKKSCAFELLLFFGGQKLNQIQTQIYGVQYRTTEIK
ncbi:hypothetical protein AQUCO_01900014v1 [Aquilegia coerulea]|uniref:AAA+ ATPase domain-containing protein n=1 Tax=Aquilegia coerulea TaxID=218851 RepID=A0A2G5DIK1_AQUCA|nr:hypothetical protein AQUCO_01900014v1 [Aquilegia coerulea]